MQRRMMGANARGFTLIELMIVVALLAILAAIAVPVFNNATDDARDSSTRAQLQTIRSAIVRYRADKGVEPNMTDWSALVGDGYLPGDPFNPMNDFTIIAGSPGANIGWVWRARGGGDASMQIYATAQGGTSEFAE